MNVGEEELKSLDLAGLLGEDATLDVQNVNRACVGEVVCLSLSQAAGGASQSQSPGAAGCMQH